jgi:hypothetical protein
VKTQIEQVLQDNQLDYEVEVVVRAVKMSGPTSVTDNHHGSAAVSASTTADEAEGQQVCMPIKFFIFMMNMSKLSYGDRVNSGPGASDHALCARYTLSHRQKYLHRGFQ